jgi:hypothetical protein
MFTNELRLVRSGREHIIPLSFRIREEHPEATQMAKSKGPKFYAVAVGRVAGIYNTWDECKAQVRVSPDSPSATPAMRGAANFNCNLG